MKLRNILRQLFAIKQLETKVAEAIELNPESRYIFIFNKNEVSVAQLDRIKQFLPRGSLLFRVGNVSCALKAYEIVPDRTDSMRGR